MTKKKLLVLCTGNSCRSQMAEAYLRLFSGDEAEVYSAGIEAHGLNPRAVAIMREDGIDISTHKSSTVEEYDDIEWDLILTVCDNARENCPVLPGQGKAVHHSFSDPAKASGSEEEIMETFRQVRDQIKSFSRKFALTYLT
ncbi:MAG TPA: arsenate reductase ArsC [Saprospiraceae bacterium]|nr:arsenate reductase ArsC [Saprospiraceae bacterium]MCB9329142.1 arsenate reductase ArsC [Lewinellaceae bacterium]HPQ22473.1 arsenate reductase ArsC [Saprospiraceae bacterium]HRX29757.1 arsenate reductase ArsC [Saprospiraceae bacterium]